MEEWLLMTYNVT
jgi:DNA-directed RNA polymerase III subunit RPC1